ncbi:hypothetical protein UAJ10_02405 [Nitrospirillum sp. BR 11164]|uniref:hypothetical protein n=1 Tax=Nitrospirillum sp. BR 11164 TaxID=3104324 RepID=UPI002AFFBE53|nr:hypothetical protein [Nitrospirillum sp. BR 11164]MEA1647868.1 hypothetical protein [Nitrospirillum sp. BR 11164]
MTYKRLVIAVIVVAAAVAALWFRAEWLVGTALRARFSPSVTLAPKPSPTSIADARGQDLDDLLVLLDLDRSFTAEGCAAFTRGVADLRARAGELDAPTFVMEMARLVALAGNGHTAVQLFPKYAEYGVAPVRLAWFDDGLYVIGAADAQASLLGRRVVAIDGHPADDIPAAVRPYLTGNDEHARAQGVNLLVSPALLRAVWPETDGRHLALTLTDEAGQTMQASLEAGPMAGADSLRWLPQAAAFTHLYGGRTASVETRPLDHQGLYLRLNAVMDDDKGPLARQLDAIAAGAPPGGWRWMVIDLRYNGGGDYTKIVDFTRRLPTLLAPDGNLWLLTGNATFSAGIVTLARAKYYGGARVHIIGQRVGDRDTFWGETGAPLVLRNTNTTVGYATGMHDWVHGCHDVTKCFWLNYAFGVAAGDLSPEQEVGWRFPDFAAGRDTVMDEVRDLQAAKRGGGDRAAVP